MKLYVISDIHGYEKELDEFIEYIKKDDYDNLIILGDIYNGYGDSSSNPTQIGHILSRVVTKLIIVRGNCDFSNDEKYLPVGFRDSFSLMLKGHNIYFTHGHHYFPFGILKENDIYCHGHTHIYCINKVDKFIECCPGSISIPRCGKEKSYMIIDDEKITIYNLKHEVLLQYII